MLFSNRLFHQRRSWGEKVTQYRLASESKVPFFLCDWLAQHQLWLGSPLQRVCASCGHGGRGVGLRGSNFAE